MSHHDMDPRYRDTEYDNAGFNPFSPLMIGAVAVVVALVAFLAFSSTDTNQQAEFNTSPPATSTPVPSAPAEKGPSVVPSTPPASEQPKNQ